MPWIDRLEKYLRWIAIPGLLKGIALLTAMTWLLNLMYPNFVVKLLLFYPFVLAGEWWRLVSFVVVPLVSDSYLGIEVPYSNGIWMVMNVWFLWFASNALEGGEWGTYRTTMYVLVGMLGVIVSSMVFGSVGTFFSINLSLLFAIATLVPDFRMIFVVLPVQIKWIAFGSAVMFPIADFVRGGWAPKGVVLLSYANYLVFFIPYWLGHWQAGRETYARQQRFEELKREAEKEMPSMHACVVCGRTEATNPELEFRVSSVDDAEYCREHLPKVAAPK